MATTSTKVIQIANAELGYLEKKSNAQLDDKTANAGDQNYTKYWRDIYPSLQANAWCLCFCVWCFVQAFGAEIAKKILYMTSGYTFYTPTSAQYFKNNNAWFTNPKVGDLIFFKNSTRIHHVGLVYKVSGGKVYTIEGNAGAGQQVTPNGGSVCAKSYDLGNTNIAGYGRPKYDSDATETVVQDIVVSTDRKGLEIVGATTLNIRKSPVDGDVVGAYKKGDLVMITAKAKASDDTYWFKTNKGYISGKYVEGWVKEANGRWWYITQGYKYPSNKIELIDDKWFIFDKDGWMITQDRINSDGSIKY